MSNRSSKAPRAWWGGALLAWVLLSPVSHALAWPAVTPEGPRVTVLGGRWSMVLPEGTLVGPVSGGPAGPVASQDIDGVAVVASEEGRFALRATLLEATAPADLQVAVRAAPAPCENAVVGPFGTRADVVALRCESVSPDGAFRPLVIFAVHADGWVDRIEAQIETTSPDDTAARTAGVAYAEAVLGTLRPEDAPPAVERGTIEVARACDGSGPGDPISLTLPDGWIATRRTSTTEGTLLRITHLVPFGDARPMVALELAPAGTTPPRVPEGMGGLHGSALFGEPVDWLVVAPDGDPTALRQLAVEMTIDCGGGATFARSLRASTAGPREGLDEAQRVIESLSLGGDGGHAVHLAAVSSEAPIEEPLPEGMTAEDVEAERAGHFWSYAIGGASLLLLVIALVMRSRTTRPK